MGWEWGEREGERREEQRERRGEGGAGECRGASSSVKRESVKCASNGAVLRFLSGSNQGIPEILP
jgi:hypothetical protein